MNHTFSTDCYGGPSRTISGKHKEHEGARAYPPHQAVRARRLLSAPTHSRAAETRFTLDTAHGMENIRFRDAALPLSGLVHNLPQADGWLVPDRSSLSIKLHASHIRNLTRPPHPICSFKPIDCDD